jgi:hypothetical protein
MDLSGYGPTAQVLLCGGAVLTLYLLFGILQVLASPFLDALRA